MNCSILHQIWKNRMAGVGWPAGRGCPLFFKVHTPVACSSLSHIINLQQWRVHSTIIQGSPIASISGSMSHNECSRAWTYAHAQHEHLHLYLPFFQQQAALLYLEPTSSPLLQMEPSGITCNCGHFVAFKPCLSDVNGTRAVLSPW